jgi:hypothetical protein
MPYLSPVVFAVVALVFSLFYGWYAFDIFRVDRRSMRIPERVHQFWLNFLGSIAGWLLLWVAVQRLAFVIASPVHPLKVSDFILLLVAFIGVTGFLPLSVVSFIQGIRDIAGRVIAAARGHGHDNQ